MIKARIIFLAMLFCAASSLPLLAQQPSNRAHQIGGKFMCMCGCNQVLSQCNHVGCTVSTAMLKEVDQGLARGDSEDTITQAFVQEFGTKVYAEPPHSGFSLVAWSMPAVYLAIGLVLVLFVINRWRKRPVHAVSSVSDHSGISPEMLERARVRVARETQD
ncbi:MAG TPA: cytochrome c-type biogenesis protein CcmH [Candidatus Acidoferrales bacterium]|nr:cytochrome c-type biogenesis protein CcmH [Candidatus Acidoferrales bacterium]